MIKRVESASRVRSIVGRIASDFGVVARAHVNFRQQCALPKLPKIIGPKKTASKNDLWARLFFALLAALCFDLRVF